MKILVAYFSETGNTERIATAIAEEVKAGGHDIHVKAIGELSAGETTEYDVVFIGSTCHSADVAASVRNVLDGIPQGAQFKLAGFVTHSTVMPGDDGWRKDMYEQWAGKCPATFDTVAKEKGIDLLGFFHCQGAPSPQIEAFIRSTIISDEKQWNEYVADVREHPTAEDIESARAFARRMLAKC